MYGNHELRYGFARLVVGPREHGERLDVFLARRFGRSRSAVRSRLAGGVLSGEDLPLKWSHRVRAGETVRVRKLIRPEPEVEISYRVIFQDEWILAVDKGPGIPVHPARSWRQRTLLVRLREDLGDGGLGLAHRLDRETSGVLLLGRSPAATAALSERFAAGRVAKRYLALVRGSPAFDRLRVEAAIAGDPDFPVRCRMRVDPARGRRAVTELEVLTRLEDRSLLSAVPLTGRQHQIRVHCAHLGHPLLGDKLYQDGGSAYLAMIRDGLDPEGIRRLGHVRQALHAERLELAHPVTGDVLRLTVPLADDLRALLVGHSP